MEQSTVANCWHHVSILLGDVDSTTGNPASESISLLQATLQQLNGELVSRADAFDVDEILDIIDEKVTDGIWMDNDIKKQVEYEMREQSGKVVEELEPESDKGKEKVLTLDEANKMVLQLTDFCFSHGNAEVAKLFPMLSDVRDTIRKEFLASFIQPTLKDFLSHSSNSKNA